MSNKFNPFQPNSPVYSGMFAGRVDEITGINSALFQTKNGNPNHIMLVGERGIGKTSLLFFIQKFACGEVTFPNDQYSFLTIQLNLTNTTSIIEFITLLKNKLKREIEKINPEITFLNKIWAFASQFEVSGFSYKGSTQNAVENSQVVEDFMYSLIKTVKNLTKEKKDGLVILIDEADNASAELNLGAFLKSLSELLVAENCNNVLFVLAGLPDLRDVLRKSHESSLRLFKEYYLHPLSKKEVNELIYSSLEESFRKSSSKTNIEESALEVIYAYSEGYPHFVQQICFSTFEIDTDKNIDVPDVEEGFFSKKGALAAIGVRYYQNLYYASINTAAQREILDIMAEKWDDWVGRSFISSKYSKDMTSLDNGIRALKEKNIILVKEDVKGQYKLQWASFAFWIKYQKKINKN